MLLRSVTPGRLRLIASQLETDLSKHMLVDWKDRDSLQARMRNSARIILRKFSYPIAIRDQVANRIIEALATKRK